MHKNQICLCLVNFVREFFPNYPEKVSSLMVLYTIFLLTSLIISLWIAEFIVVDNL